MSGMANTGALFSRLLCDIWPLPFSSHSFTSFVNCSIRRTASPSLLYMYHPYGSFKSSKRPLMCRQKENMSPQRSPSKVRNGQDFRFSFPIAMESLQSVENAEVSKGSTGNAWELNAFSKTFQSCPVVKWKNSSLNPLSREQNETMLRTLVTNLCFRMSIQIAGLNAQVQELRTVIAWLTERLHSKKHVGRNL